MPYPKLVLKPGREKSLNRFHPWIFSGGVEKLIGTPEPGATVAVYNSKKECLALAAYSSESQIQARVWSFDQSIEIDQTFFTTQIQRALDQRQQLGIDLKSNAYRLIASESDGLPGLIVDKYANTLVFQLLSQGTEYWRDEIIHALNNVFPDHNIHERSDVSVRKKEGLKKRTETVTGLVADDHITINENNYQLLIDVKHGHKTGFYLDQRDSRLAIQQYVKNKTVLNCFSYTGGFSVSALKAGASHVTNIDESQAALDIAKSNIELNELDNTKLECVQGDVFKQLRLYRDQGKTFDVIVLDPPKFADNKSQINRACRGYKDINLSALKLLKPGGILLTFSCSGLISPDLFQKTVAGAAVDAGKKLSIIERLDQAPDHPTSIHFPEGHYLKGLVCLVTE